jgi:hypothetical protein
MLDEDYQNLKIHVPQASVQPWRKIGAERILVDDELLSRSVARSKG